MKPAPLAILLELPAWSDELAASYTERLDTDEERMALAVALSRRNVEEGGGPFGAAVFSGPSLLTVAVNRVNESGLSIAHAEIAALSRAQQLARGVAVGRPLTLVTSTEPCCQCFGAILWSGLDRVVCGATTFDAEAVGFDEGPKPLNWERHLTDRGIAVTQRVLRDSAKAVLDDYGRRGGPSYGRTALRR